MEPLGTDPKRIKRIKFSFIYVNLITVEVDNLVSQIGDYRKY